MRRFTLAAILALAQTFAAHAGEPAGNSLVRVAKVENGCLTAAGSGTVIACENGRSLVLTNNHIFANQPYPGAPFPRAAYPIAAVVDSRTRESETVTQHRATAVDGRGCGQGDLALLVVEGELPCVELADTDAPAGVTVWHSGLGSRGGVGVVCAPPADETRPEGRFVSTASSISGDSGCGVFGLDGRLVGMNRGFRGNGPAKRMLGTPVSAIRQFLRERTPVVFPRLAARLRPETAEPPKAK